MRRAGQIGRALLHSHFGHGDCNGNVGGTIIEFQGEYGYVDRSFHFQAAGGMSSIERELEGAHGVRDAGCDC